MGRQSIIPEHEQQEMGFVLDSQPPREKYRGNEQQQDEGQKKKLSWIVLSWVNWRKTNKKDNWKIINSKSTDKQWRWLILGRQKNWELRERLIELMCGGWLVGAILKRPDAAWPCRLWMERLLVWAKDWSNGRDSGGKDSHRGYRANTLHSCNGLENSLLWPQVLTCEICSYKCLFCYSIMDW